MELITPPTVQPKVPSPPLQIGAPSETPVGLKELVSYINGYPYLEEESKKILLQAIQPSFYRKYFSVTTAPDLTQPIVDRILSQFQRATGLDPSQLILYGVTDTHATLSHSKEKAQVTYLLPAFGNLKTMEEKMTALVHENYWVLHPNATYLDVVTAEMAFEAAMQKPDDTLRAIAYVESVVGKNTYNTTFRSEEKKYSNSPWLMKLRLKHDLETGALTGFVNGQNQITNITLLGLDNINCYRKYGGDICDTMFLNYRDSLLRQYPNSLFLDATKYLEVRVKSNYSGMSYLLFDMLNVLLFRPRRLTAVLG